MNAEYVDPALKNRHSLFYDAIRELILRNPAYVSNRKMFAKWDDHKREWWCRSIELKAQQGLPMAVEIMTEVIALRMKG